VVLQSLSPQLLLALIEYQQVTPGVTSSSSNEVSGTVAIGVPGHETSLAPR